jgi:dihydroorotase (multifunctional complex type)
MSVDLLIKNAKLVSPQGTQPGSVAIKDSKIVAIGEEAYMPEAAETVDAGGKFLIPGGIDLHVHFRDPGLTYKEDFTTGSTAAAMGGVTTVFDMPNTEPVMQTVEAFEEKRKIAQEKSYVNFAFYTYLADGMQDTMEELIDVGIAGVKWDHDSGKLIYPTGYGTLKNYDLADNGVALQIFRILAKHGYNVGVHAEDMDIMIRLREELKAAGRTDFRAHLDSRPDYVELMGLERAMRLAEITGCHLHVHHLSSRAGLEMIKERRFRGLSVSSEAGPPWLFFSAEDYDRMGALIRVTPAVKEKYDMEALWQGLCDGSIESYATDHAPHSYEEKMRRTWDLALPGAIGVETSIPLLLNRVNKGDITLERVVAVACENPAKIYKLYPRKGTIMVGADADLVLLDMDKKWTITNEGVHSKNHLTPFNGWDLQGMPVMTIVNGNIIVKDHEIVGKPGFGKLVNPKKEW